MNIETLLLAIGILLLLIFWKLSDINSRLKDRFPSEKELDSKWAKENPMGHWEAHKDDKR
jgi:hypothetical protein